MSEVGMAILLTVAALGALLVVLFSLGVVLGISVALIAEIVERWAIRQRRRQWTGRKIGSV